MSSYNVNIFASFPKDSLYDPQMGVAGYKNASFYLNTTPANQTCAISAHNIGDITQLVISSNGITDGNFDIYPIKYAGEHINFVVSLKDYLDFDVRDYSLLDYNNFTFNLSTTDGEYVSGVEFHSNFGTLSSLTQGGFFKGYLYSRIVINDVIIKAVYTDTNLNLTAYSTVFHINSSCGEYEIRKINENFDQIKAFKTLGTQPVLIDKPQFFDNFLGQIVGNADSDPNTLGIEIYEKVANYVANINDPDYCNVDSLKALLDEVNSTYQNFNYNYPASFKRLVDILSVKHKNLFGQTNQYQGNFDPKGFTNSTQYGLNRGSMYDFATTQFQPGAEPYFILTYEKFSKKYNLVSTSIPEKNLYSLSAVDSSYGWDLVLPPGVNGLDVTKYYEFYEYVPGVEGSQLQKFIDFDNKNNTLLRTNSSYEAYTERGGIMDNVLLHNLLTNLQVISCLPNEVNSNKSQVIFTPTPTPTITPTQTPTPTVTPTQTITPSVTPTNTVTPSITPTITLTPSITPSQTPTPSITPSITPTITLTPSITPTITFTPSTTPQPTPTPTGTPASTPTPTPTPTPLAVGAGILYVTYD